MMRWTFALALGAIFSMNLNCASPPGGNGGSRNGPDTSGDQPGAPGASDPGSGGGGGNGSSGDRGRAEDLQAARRSRMVDLQIMARGIKDPRVLEALRKVPRHLFVPDASQGAAYEDGPLSIGEGQTISQPYIVALMTELIQPKPGDRVLEVGTGSGYQAAVLAEVVAEVDTIEIVEPLGRHAAALLSELGYKNIHTRIGDGYQGWPEKAPYDAILVTAAPEHIPEPLKSQLAVGGRLVIPIGSLAQELILLTRTEQGYIEEHIAPVRFVPMTGEAERHR